MTKEQLQKDAEEWVDKNICFGGLEHSLSGYVFKENVASHIAGAESRQAEIDHLKQCCKDFDFVLEGSRANPWQDEIMLDRRERALMRALDWNKK